MRRWMDEQDTFQGTQPGYWYDDGQPEPAYEYGSSMVDDTGMRENPTLAQMQALYSVPQEMPQPDADALAQMQASYSVPQEMPQPEPAYEYGSSMVGDMARRKNPVQVSADARVSDAGRDQRMGAYDYSEAGYSPETVKYLDDMVAQRQALSDKYGEGIALNNPDYMYSRYVQDAGGADESYKVYTPEEDIRRIMASGQDASEIFDPGYNVQSFGGSRNPNQFDFVRLGAGKTYTYTDNNTGETYTASTPEQVQALTQLAKSQSGAGNNSASWSIKDSSGKEVASDTSYTPSFLKQAGQTIADLAVEYGIPMLLTAGVVNPALLAAAGISSAGPLAMALGTGLSTGTQMAVAGGAAALGKGLKTGDLKKSLISGLTAAGTVGLLNASGASDFIGNALGGVGAGEATAQEAAQAIARGTTSGLTAAELASGQALIASGKFVSNAAVNAGTSATTGALENVIVSGIKSGVGSGVGSTLAPVISSGIASAATPSVTKATENVVVTGTKPTNTGVDVAPVVAPAITPAVTNSGPAPSESVVVSGKKLPPSTIAPTIPALAPFQPPSASVASLKPPEIPPVEKSTVGKVLPYVEPALIAAGLIANTVGSTKKPPGTGTGTIGTYVPDPLPKIFTDPLPGVVKPTELPKPYSATDPGAGGRNLTDEDWYSYGFGPEKSFFTDVPGTPIGVREPAPKLPIVPDPNLAVIPKPKLPVVPDPKLAVTPNPKLPVAPDPKLAVTPSKGLVKPETLLEARLKEMGTWVNDKTGNKYLAKGGSTNRFAVRGPGTGRSDDIPANLSDGEYVIDAETVALLGDGSSKAGADKLDRFRVNVRKHKGKSLAAGRFSVAAKRPEVYLKGRT